MGKSNNNWEPDIKKAYQRQKNKKYGIDPNDKDRFQDLGNTIKNKRGVFRWIAVLLVILVLLDLFLNNGELISNILKNFGK